MKRIHSLEEGEKWFMDGQSPGFEFRNITESRKKKTWKGNGNNKHSLGRGKNLPQCKPRGEGIVLSVCLGEKIPRKWL